MKRACLFKIKEITNDMLEIFLFDKKSLELLRMVQKDIEFLINGTRAAPIHPGLTFSKTSSGDKVRSATLGQGDKFEGTANSMLYLERLLLL